jgi:hypothetical protein
MKIHIVLAAAATLVLVGCATSPPPAPPPVTGPIPLTPPAEQADAPVVRREIAPLTPPPVAAPRPAEPGIEQPLPPVARPQVVVPADAIYVCVVNDQGTRRQTVIEFVPKVHELCRRHPEMGPCQYERNVCRSAGGRVYAANGQEITMATEAEYDRKVMRVRFRAN